MRAPRTGFAFSKTYAGVAKSALLRAPRRRS
jgi:hypothetical protein